MKTRVEKLAEFLNEQFPHISGGLFDCRNTAGDEMNTVYNQDGIQVDFCEYYDYLEIFGLNEEEWKILHSIYSPKDPFFNNDVEELVKEYIKDGYSVDEAFEILSGLQHL